jgi:thioredoxin-like negative regulator of GroEL
MFGCKTQWCENCKLTASTLHAVEEEYKESVNFVMVDGDKRASGDLIEAFGVDAIPHLALVSAEGDVMTALIGPIPKTVLEADLDGTYW